MLPGLSLPRNISCTASKNPYLMIEERNMFKKWITFVMVQMAVIEMDVVKSC